MKTINMPNLPNKWPHLTRWGLLLFIVMIFAVYLVESKSSYNYKVYAVEHGYGYQIKKGDKIIIQQDFIPTQEGYQPFIRKEHAELAAQKVVSKLVHNKVPALSFEEINAIINSQ